MGLREALEKIKAGKAKEIYSMEGQTLNTIELSKQGLQYMCYEKNYQDGYILAFYRKGKITEEIIDNVIKESPRLDELEWNLK